MNLKQVKGMFIMHMSQLNPGAVTDTYGSSLQLDILSCPLSDGSDKGVCISKMTAFFIWLATAKN